MGRRNDRFAGYALAGVPLQDITEDVKKSLSTLRNNRSEASSNNLQDSFTMNGRRVELRAGGYGGPYLPEQIDDKARIYGDPEQFQRIANANPQNEYSLAWSVDGSYGGDMSADKKANLRIAREVDRRWQKLIAKMPEGSIVSNSPTGASGGDYERADLYMRRGFGPVQNTGMQYGIVQDGIITPISPGVVDDRYAEHLAKRSRAAGRDDIAQSIENNLQNLRNFRDQPAPDGGYNKTLSEGGGGYDDYDYYDDDDYQPPASRRDIEQSLGYFKREPVAGIPEVAAFERINRDSAYGLNFDPTPDDIQRVRDLQLSQLNRESPVRDLSDSFNEMYPRPLPQPITADDLNRRGGRRRDARLSAIGTLEPSERREAAVNALRQGIDASARDDYGGITGTDEDLIVRNELKESLVDIDGTLIPGTDIIRELYDETDVANLRVLQEAAARLQQPGTEGRQRRRRPRRPRLDYDVNDPAITSAGRMGKNGELGMINDGFLVQEMRMLTPEQQAAVRRIEGEDRLFGDNELLPMLDSRFQSSGMQGPVFQRIYEAGSADELISSVGITRPDPNMTLAMANDILETSIAQPGRTSREELAQAIVNLRQDAPAVDPDMAVLMQAARGPAAFINRTTNANRPRIPREEILLQQQNRVEAERLARGRDRDGRIPTSARRRELEGARGYGYGSREYDSYPDDLSLDEFLDVRQTQQPAGARTDMDDVLDAGVLTPTRYRDPQNFQMAVQRGDRSYGNWTDGGYRRGRAAVVREPGPPLPDAFPVSLPAAPRVTVQGNDIYGQPATYQTAAPMRDQLANLEQISEALQNQQPFRPQFDIDGNPVISYEDITRLGYTNYEDAMNFMSRVNAVSPVSTPAAERFDTQELAARERNRRRLENETMEASWNAAPLVPDDAIPF